MSLTLQDIGLGTAANDGTGDTPRAAGTKINANNAAIIAYLKALANLDTVGTAQIDNGAVTLAKIANIADQRLLGNVSGISAAPAELTAAQVKTMLALSASDVGAYTTTQVDTLLASYQPLDSDLTAIAALTTTTFGRSLLTQADAAAARITLGISAVSTPIDSTAGASIAIGSSALAGQTSSAAYGNTAVGYQALSGIMTSAAVNNTALGYQALKSITSGSTNAAFGYQALSLTTSGGANSAFGHQALQNNTSDGNAAFGFRAMWQTTSGGNNTALGAYALYNNQTGGANVAVGTQALLNSTSGNSTAVGNEAAAIQSSGAANTAIGNFALRDNTTGSNNAIVGMQAFRYGIGSRNAVLGKDAGLGVNATTTATDSVFLGYQAGLGITTGNDNIFIGSGAGSTTTTGSGNIVIGKGLTTASATTSNSINVGGMLGGVMSASAGVLELSSGGSMAIRYYGGSGYGSQPVNIEAPNGLAIIGTNKRITLSTDTWIEREAAGVTAIRGNGLTSPGALSFYTYGASPPTAPSASIARLYADTSGGKIRLMAVFPSGAAQQIAIEP